MSDGMVILGAGEAGARAAAALRENGYDGQVTMIGAETHLPYERPPLSKEALTAKEPPAPKTILDKARLEALRISLIPANPATAIDRAAHQLELKDGTTVSYDKLLIATGAAPRRLPMPGTAGRRVAYLRTFDDARRLRADIGEGRRVAIIGGGFIGLELAASSRQRGAGVTIVEALPRLLSRVVPADIAKVVEKRHRAEGVEILCGDGVAEIAETDDAITLWLVSGRQVTADILIIGVGAVPVTHPAGEAGLELDNGIAVDATLCSSDPDIFAAGDCCSFPLPLYGDRRVRLESWRAAQDHGNLAARNMLGAGELYSAVPWFWSDQYDMTLQIAGLPDEGSTKVRRNIGEGAFLLFHISADGRLVAASGIGPGSAVARDISISERLIGKGLRPDLAQLASSDFKLKALLRA